MNSTTTSTSKTTTFVVLNQDGTVLDSRSTDSMGYTHAVVGKDGAYTWHTSEANARKALQARKGDTKGLSVQPVVGHQGTKATVLRRLAAEEAARKAEGSSKPALEVVEGGKGKKAAGTKAKTPAKSKAASKAKASTSKAAAPVKKTTPPASAVKGVQHPGAVFLALMEKAGTSQTKTANAMGVAPMTLNRLCNGHGLPTAKVTVAFAKAVDADPREVWSAVCEYELALALAAK
jgi:plasmid maintenance system antidote protein VapI